MPNDFAMRNIISGYSIHQSTLDFKFKFQNKNLIHIYCDE